MIMWVRFSFLTTLTMKNASSYDLTPYNLLVYRRFRGTYCICNYRNVSSHLPFASIFLVVTYLAVSGRNSVGSYHTIERPTQRGQHIR